MKYHYSLRNRIIVAFCVFGFALSLTYWLLIDISMNFAEDIVFENRLENEIDSYFHRYRADPGALLPYSMHIRSYIGLTDMPMLYKQMVENLPEGFYETEGPTGIEGPGDYHVAVKKMPDHDAFLYVFFDVGVLKVNEKYESIVRAALLFTSLIVAGVGGVIGALIARRVIAPVTELADHVARSVPDNLPVELSKQFADDEIGFLARTLEQSMQRIQAFIEREKEFTRDASHELRNPVTVIKGAIELIEQLPAYRDRSLQRPMKRIERSVKGMALTIDTFLWLAREDSKYDIDQTCDVVTEVREALAEYQYLFKDKKIETELHENDAPVIDAPAPVFRIVMNNLLRNAFHYTPRGKIRLTVKNTGIELFNSGFLNISSEIESIMDPHVRGKESDGFGFGLAIVKRLCKRFGWRLEIEGRPDHGTVVTLGIA